MKEDNATRDRLMATNAFAFPDTKVIGEGAGK